MVMFRNIFFFLYELKETALFFAPGRWLYSLILLRLARRAFNRGHSYTAVSYALRVERDITAVNPAKIPAAVARITNCFLDLESEDWSRLVESYRQSDIALRHRQKYCVFPMEDRLRIRHPKISPPPERQGDLLVLKPCLGKQEKGVLFLNFDETVDKFFALYDVEHLAQSYRIVFEPSAWGYQQPRFYLLRGLDTDVVVEAQYRQDYEYIEKMSGALRPIRLGAGDWVDPELFRSGREQEKKYDLVMVANWLKWKRHKLLFKAMRQLGLGIGKVALIGYPIEGRTRKDILRLAQNYDVEEKIDIFENISATEVGSILRSAKAGIMLSKKEGANRGIYECFFSDIPVILTSCNIGVNRDHINAETGMLVNDRDLPDAIKHMCTNHAQFHPRAWASTNTGWANSTRRLNELLKGLARCCNEEWSLDIFPKKNAPAPLYLLEEDRRSADLEISRLEQFLLT